MIETITPAGCGGRNRYRLALLLFTLAAIAAAAVVGAFLGLVGGALGVERAVLLLAAVAALAAAREAGLVRVPLPQLRRQVPERWHHELPLPLWATGYGAGLGIGFATFQPVATFWVAVLAALAVGRPVTAAAGFALYGVGRAAMVVFPPRPQRDVTRVVERLAARRPLLKRANAVALAACAVLLAGAPVAAAEELSLGVGSELDPTRSGSVIAYTKRVDGVKSVIVRVSDTERYTFEGESPSLSGPYLAYTAADGVHVVEWRAPETPIVISNASKPALDWPRLVYRRVADDGTKRLWVENLSNGWRRRLMTVSAPIDIGRATIADDRIAWHTASATGSSIFIHRIKGWTRQRFRRSRIALLAYPAVSPRRIVWADQRPTKSYLRLYRFGASRSYTLATSDRRSIRYWTTALYGRHAYVTRWKTGTRGALIVHKRF
jgi:hypothetical protein